MTLAPASDGLAVRLAAPLKEIAFEPPQQALDEAHVIERHGIKVRVPQTGSWEVRLWIICVSCRTCSMHNLSVYAQSSLVQSVTSVD